MPDTGSYMVAAYAVVAVVTVTYVIHLWLKGRR